LDTSCFDIVDHDQNLLFLDDFFNESESEELVVGLGWDGEIEFAIGFLGAEGVTVVEVLADRGMEFGDGGGFGKAFDFDGDFFGVALGGEEAFGSEVDLHLDVAIIDWEGIMGDLPAFKNQGVFDDIVK
jgi:hypothetical protein